LIAKLKKDLKKMRKEAEDLDTAQTQKQNKREAEEAAKQKKEFEEKKRKDEAKAKALAYAKAKKEAEDTAKRADSMSGAKATAVALEANTQELLKQKRAYEKRLDAETDETKANALLNKLAELELKYMEAKGESDEARATTTKFEAEEATAQAEKKEK